MTKETFVYRPSGYKGPEARNITPSEECKKYHENSYVQINYKGKSFLRKTYTPMKKIGD